jgi:SnoaL-like domain
LDSLTSGQLAAPAADDMLRVLVAIEEIRVLKSRYFQAVDEKDYGTIAELFTRDAVVDFSGEPRFHVGHHGVTEQVRGGSSWSVVGGEAAARIIAGAVQDVVSVHQGHDPRIFVETPTTARGRWSLYDRLEYADETMHGYGHYQETYTREEGQWRFSSLLLTRLRVVWAPNR